ncbi:bifunctional diguanylate cyclase/phosphodiesterase [Bradyrhizobium guangdongense]|uniref:bifunctional diguanylate cyclase/phosphodiesterase n=1 Tax=Bradyrhizobium guangdongense TaxID=1325090 RepID=UPI0016435ADA|nr:PAS-domain containing protein [Bradyrhizobium guangdongense]
MALHGNSPFWRRIRGDHASKAIATWSLLAFTAIVGLAVLGLAIVNIVVQRATILSDGKADTANLARSLKQHAELTFRTADAILTAFIERLERDDFDSTGRARLKALFRQEVNQTSQFVSFAVVDANGSLILSSASDDVSQQVSDRDYFAFHKENSGRGLHIGAPVRGRAVKDWLIPATRRFNSVDGSFGGVVVAAINPKYFQEFYESFDLGANGAILLASLDGSLLVRRPFAEANIGRDMSRSGIFNELKRSSRGTVELTASTDGITRINSYERDEAYPFVVAVAKDTRELLAPRYEAASRRAVEAVGIAVLIALLGTAIWRATRRIEQNAVEMADTNARFDAALTNMSTGLCMFDADGALVVWNERYVQLHQLPPEVLRRGINIKDMLAYRKRTDSPELDVDAYVARLRQSLTETGEGHTLLEFNDRAISITNKVIAGGGWVGIHEDVTDRKRQERLIVEKAAELEIINKRFEAALANMAQGVCLFDVDRKLVISNERFREMYDVPQALVEPGTPMKVLVDHQFQKGVRDELSADANSERIPSLLQQVVLMPDGRVISIRRTPVVGGGWVATHDDITDQRHQQRLMAEKAAELAIMNGRFDAALSNMSQGISMFDQERRLVVWNARYAEIFKFPPGYLKPGIHVNTLATDLLSWGILQGERNQPAILKKIETMDGRPTDTDWVEELADGRSISISRQPMRDGGWVATSEDITERRKAEAEIVRLARHDPLTGLANRAEFASKLEDACKRVKRYGGAISVMMLDLDKFKAVNDTLGHPAGDKLLVEVAHRLRASLRETDLLARLGGDEFAIIQECGADQHEGAIALALRIINAITQPFDLDGHEASVGTSIGIALAPEHGADPAELLKRADLALYAVKAGGRNDFQIFRSEMLDAANAQQSEESQLRVAIEREEFELHYQPVFDVRTRQVCAAEALVRWNHPTRGLIGPDQFIPLAESTGLIVPLGDWVLQRAVTDAASWPAHVKVAVNISAVQFRKGSLFDVILCTLVETGLAPHRLELEITETAFLENRDDHLASIRQLKNLGLSVAIDDFGTGYASMGYLTAFPFDKIKIDKSFAQGALSRRECKAVVASTLTLAQGLGIVTTAEGVETEEQFRFMRDAGVDFVQGYLVGRPVPLSQLDLLNAGEVRGMVA